MKAIMKLWIIRHVNHERLGHLPSILEELGLPYQSISLSQGDRFPSLEEVSGVITMGGPMSSYDKSGHEWIEKEEQFLREVHAQAKPILGICLGAQILAQAFGATVRKAPECELGWISLIPTNACSDRLLDGVPIPPLFHYHYDRFDLPPTAVNLLKSAQAEHQMFRLGESTYGLQFHPEANEAMIQGVFNDYEQHLSLSLRQSLVLNIEERSEAGRRFFVSILSRLFNEKDAA